MPVVRGAAVALVLTATVVLLGCDPPASPKPIVVRAAANTTDASAAPLGSLDAGPNVDEAELVKMGRRVRDAGTAVAKRCSLYQRNIVSNLGAFSMQESCNVRDAVLEELASAVAAFKPAAERAGGAAAAFATEAAMFSEFVALSRPSEGSGTLAHYQDFARFWNNWRKDEVTTLDPVEPYSGWKESGVTRVNGVAKWERCGNAPCLRVKNP